MELELRPTVIGGDKLNNEFVVVFEGRSIGRIRRAEERYGHNPGWDWAINPPLPIPPWGNGSTDSSGAGQVRVQSGVGEVLRHPDAGEDHALASPSGCGETLRNSTSMCGCCGTLPRYRRPTRRRPLTEGYNEQRTYRANRETNPSRTLSRLDDHGFWSQIKVVAPELLLTAVVGAMIPKRRGWLYPQANLLQPLRYSQFWEPR